MTLADYQVQAPLKAFLDRVSEDQDLPKRERKRVARNVLRSYKDYMAQQGLKPKTVNTYITAIQSLASYFEIEITTKFLNLPKPKVQTKAHAWLPETIAKFTKLLEQPMYQAINAIFYQSGLSISDTLDLSYGDIKKEFEAGTVPIQLDFTEKGRHKTQVEFRSFISDESVELLRRHFKASGVPAPEEKLFKISDRAVQDYYVRRAKEMLGSWNNRNPCLLPNVIISGDFKPISEYLPGDYTAEGGTVNQVFCTPFKGSIRTIKASGLLPLKLTDEHLVAVMTMEAHGSNNRRKEFTEQYFKPARIVNPVVIEECAYVKGDYLVVPKLKGTTSATTIDLRKYTRRRGHFLASITLNEDVAWLLGLYVAEGNTTSHRNGRPRAVFNLHIKEIQLAEKIRQILKAVGCSTFTEYLIANNGMKISAYSSILARLLQDICGQGAANKVVPQIIFEHVNLALVKSFIDGYIAGDGYTTLRGGHRGWIEADTKSKALALGLQMLFFRLGYVAGIKTRFIPERVIQGSSVKASLCYVVSAHKPQQSHIRMTDDKVLCPVKSVKEEQYEGFVWNLETDNNVFLASNAIVHNCSPHSVRKAFRKIMVNDGCPESYAEYFMGHDLDSDLRKIYTEMNNDEWRREYAKHKKALSFRLPPGAT